MTDRSSRQDAAIRKVLYDQFSDCVDLITYEEGRRYIARIDMGKIKARAERIILEN